MEMASDGFAMGKSVKRGKNSKKMDGKTYAMLGITEEEEMFLNTKAGQPMTAEKRAMQRRYWVAEDEWKTTPMFVLFPVAPGKQAWDLLIMLQVVYMCLVMPYRAVFEVAEGSWFVFETCIQFLFLTDVLLSFNTAYLDVANEIWVVQRKRIAIKYLSFWFWIDFPSSIPIELIQHLVHSSGDSAMAHLLPAMRMLRLFRLLRLVRLFRLAEMIKRIEDETGYSLSALGIVNTVIMMMIFCHILACLFYYVGTTTEDDVEKNWLTAFDNGYIKDPDTPVFDAYIIAFLWAMGLVCGANRRLDSLRFEEEAHRDQRAAVLCLV